MMFVVGRGSLCIMCCVSLWRVAVVRCLMFVVGCQWFVAVVSSSLRFVVRVFADRCPMRVAWCLLFGSCCSVLRCVSFVVCCCANIVVWCLAFVVWNVRFACGVCCSCGCALIVAIGSLVAVGWLLLVVCCVL